VRTDCRKAEHPLVTGYWISTRAATRQRLGTLQNLPSPLANSTIYVNIPEIHNCREMFVLFPVGQTSFSHWNPRYRRVCRFHLVKEAIQTLICQREWRQQGDNELSPLTLGFFLPSNGIAGPAHGNCPFAPPGVHDKPITPTRGTLFRLVLHDRHHELAMHTRQYRAHRYITIVGDITKSRLHKGPMKRYQVVLSFKCYRTGSHSLQPRCLRVAISNCADVKQFVSLGTGFEAPIRYAIQDQLDACPSSRCHPRIERCWRLARSRCQASGRAVGGGKRLIRADRDASSAARVEAGLPHHALEYRCAFERPLRTPTDSRLRPTPGMRSPTPDCMKFISR